MAQVLNPVTVAAGTFVSSTLAEADYTVWSAATAYPVGQRAIRTTTHRIYERKVPGTTSATPESDPDNWLDVAPTNRWAMFDDGPASSSSGASPISVVIAAGMLVTGVVLLGVIGTTVQVYDGATLVKTVSVPAPVSPSVSSTVVITGLSIASGTNTTVTLTGTGTLQISHLTVGAWIDLGEAIPGVQVGITDFSVKSVDAFGVASITRRNYSRKLQGQLIIASSDVQRVADVLASLRSRVTYWSLVDAYESLGVLGYLKDWAIDTQGTWKTQYSLNIEGLARDDAVIAAGGADVVLPNVSGYQITPQVGGAQLQWTPQAPYDVEVRAGDTWSTASRLWSGPGSSWLWPWPAAGSYMLLLKHVDGVGAESLTASSMLVQINADGTLQPEAVWHTAGGLLGPWNTASGAPARWIGPKLGYLVDTQAIADGAVTDVYSTTVSVVAVTGLFGTPTGSFSTVAQLVFTAASDGEAIVTCSGDVAVLTPASGVPGVDDWSALSTRITVNGVQQGTLRTYVTQQQVGFGVNAYATLSRSQRFATLAGVTYTVVLQAQKLASAVSTIVNALEMRVEAVKR